MEYGILSDMKLPFTPRKFKRTGEIASELGPLEHQVMELIWRHTGEAAEVSVRDVHMAFEGRLAYTTLMTTLDRLHKKGWLERRKEGRAFYYSPRFSPDEFERSAAREVINKLLGRGRSIISAARYWLWSAFRSSVSSSFGPDVCEPAVMP